MTCSEIQGRLTAYLDGELDGELGSVVRGHLRECAACRQVASDEALLRDGLRTLPPVDPPPSLWAGVQARLAAAEVADARRPAWRRAIARWAPVMPRIATGTLVAAAAIGLLWWRAHRADDEQTTTAIALPVPAPTKVAPPRAVAPPALPPPEGDVTADLAAEPARRAASYSQAAEELLALAGEARAQWSEDRKGAFDARVSELRRQIEQATAGRVQHKAWRELIRYLEGAVVRDEIALAGGAP